MRSTDFNDLKSWRQNGIRPRVTLQGLANALEMKSIASLSNIENGLRAGDDHVARLAALYQIPVSEFKRLNARMSPAEWAARDRATPDQNASEIQNQHHSPVDLVTIGRSV